MYPIVNLLNGNVRNYRNMYECLICNKKFQTKRGLSNHIRIHGIDSSDYKRIFFDELHKDLKEGIDYVICPICGEERSGQLIRHLHNKHNLSDDEIKNLGIKLKTDKFKEASKIAHEKVWTDEARKKYSESIRKAIAKCGSKEWAKRSLANCNRSETQRKASKSFWDRIRNSDKETQDKYYNISCGNLKSANHGKRIEYHDSYRNITCRSSYEFKLCEILNNLGIEFKYEPFWIDYINPEDGKVHKYCPDILIVKSNLVLEVKPERFINDEVVIAKANSVMENGYDFLFITESKLNEDYIREIIKI